MSDQNNDTAPQAPTELQVLKQRATLLGINFSNNIGVDALRAKIEAKTSGEPEVVDNDTDTDDQDEVIETPAALDPQIGAAPPAMPEPVPAPAAQVAATPVAPAPPPAAAASEPVAAPARKLTALEQKNLARQAAIKDAMRLVRLRITNLNPNKKDLPGEIFTVGNNVIGTVRRYIPYGEQTDDGYHVEHVIYLQLLERRFLNIRTVKDKRTGINRPHTSWAKEFALEVMDPLTQEELDNLKHAQAASGSTNTTNSLD